MRSVKDALDGSRFTSAFEAGRKAKVGSTVPTFQAGKLSRERQCSRSAQAWHLTNSKAPLKAAVTGHCSSVDLGQMSWGSSKTVVWPPSCEHRVMGQLIPHEAEVVLGHGSFWLRTPGPLITSVNKLLTHSSSANGIELWFGCFSQVGVYGDPGLAVCTLETAAQGALKTAVSNSALFIHTQRPSSSRCP